MLIVNEDRTVQLTRGDTAEFEVGITRAEDGSVYEMQSGDKLVLSLKRDVKLSEYVLQKTVFGGNLIRIEPQDTSELKFGKYLYDVQLTTASGDVYTIIPPTHFEIAPEVTC